uniref:Major facilitator superfamily (MFS) profile domain-containing protein n=1 Tax=Amphimedon queenslandica TaxID=400682 RepID=A0A1X7V188_AMPQE
MADIDDSVTEEDRYINVPPPNVEEEQQACNLASHVVFVGFLIGGLFWRIIADIIGHKRFSLFLFGLASAAAPNYGSLLLFRCLAGFGIGGTAQTVTHYTEFLPKKLRGACLVLIEVWRAIGSCLAALLALGVIPNVPDPIDVSNGDFENINWRIYIALCALPYEVFYHTVFFIFVPESARFHISKGHNQKGQRVIESIARINLKPPPKGRLVSQDEKEMIEEEKKAAADPEHTNNEPILGAEQKAKGALERQKSTHEAEAEKSRKDLLELQANSAAVESTGQAKAEAQSRAEAAKLKEKQL